MTVIRPNSISGITSITAQANDINFFRSDGTLAALQINGINFNNTSGISTLAALNVTGNVSIAGTLTYEDVTNVDSVGIITARSNILVGSGITLSPDGDIFATGISTFVGNVHVDTDIGGENNRFLVGSNSLRNVGGSASSGSIQIEGTSANSSSMVLVNNQNSAQSPNIRFGKTRGTAFGAVTTVADGDSLGKISFSGADGTDLDNNTAQIEVVVNGTVAGNTIPSDITFQTSAAGTSGRAERLRIDSSGRVLIGGTSAVIASSSEFAEIVLTGKTRGAGITLEDVDANTRFQIRTDDNGDGILLNASTNDLIAIRTNNTKRLEIATDGKLFIDRTHASSTTGNHPAIDIDTYANGTAGATFATGIDFRVAGVHKKRMVVTNGSGTGGGDWIFYRDQGNNEALRISSTGAVTKPVQPCAVVYQCTGPAGGAANASSDNEEPLHFDHVHINQGGMTISQNNGRIEVPVTGIYFVSYMVSGTVTSVDANDGIELLLLVNGNEYPATNSGAEPVFNFGDVANQSEFFANNTLLVSLTGGDYVEVALDNIGSSPGADATINRGNFSIMLMA